MGPGKDLGRKSWGRSGFGTGGRGRLRDRSPLPSIGEPDVLAEGQYLFEREHLTEGSELRLIRPRGHWAIFSPFSPSAPSRIFRQRVVL